MTVISAESALRLESIVRAVPGVQTVFPVDSLVATVLSRLKSSANSPALPHISITWQDGRAIAVIHLGVHSTRPIPHIAHDVYAAASAELHAEYPGSLTIRIRISSID